MDNWSLVFLGQVTSPWINRNLVPKFDKVSVIDFVSRTQVLLGSPVSSDYENATGLTVFKRPLQAHPNRRGKNVSMYRNIVLHWQ